VQLPQVRPELHGGGSPRGGRGEKAIWDEFAGDQQRLARIAANIRAVADDPEARARVATFAEEEEGEAPEGRVLYRLHRTYERRSSLGRKKKARVLRERGKLVCEVCGFDFPQQYGHIGNGFIECHHTRPVSELGPGTVTRLRDLALVCANCHRMLHRGDRWLTVDELRQKARHNFS